MEHEINIYDYKYSISDLALTREQRDFYEVNGYLVIPKLIPDYLLDRCCDHFVDLCNGKAPRNQITMMKDISRMKCNYQGEYLYAKAQDILYDEEFYEYARYPKMLDIVESIIGPNVMAMHSMFINKQPDIGTNSSRHPVHQDLHYFPFRPTNWIVAAWTACGSVTENNGCLYVIPGSHTSELHSHYYPEPKDGEINKMYHEMKTNKNENYKKVFLEMEKGDTVFFHPLLIHGSGINKSQDFRRCISVHYASSDCYYIDVAGTSQESIQNEILDIAAKKGLTNIDYKLIWKNRGRLIRGLKANL
ncbi:Phytanoyl-CoA dioxygenase [Cinara cedri]|uniref:phytanoyl-CoA dioxygenase n=1 Tax=Cinara cedri TaxID=506608 RepID=A0A5E4MPZ2_9HEMI|nr:Phytanoyl-CoA dioxygenase [Cinara cedri]